MDKKSIKLLFIGSGAFASALANCFLTQKGNNVKILFYCVGEAEFNDILKQQNTKYFPNEKFGRKIDMVSLDLKKCLIQKPDYIVLACPSKFIADNVTKIQKMLINNPIFINIAKGFSSEGTLWSDWFKKYFPTLHFISLAGPSYADEMFRSLPTTVNISGNNKTDINKTAILFNKANKNFSVVKINNTKNMQILSIIKNIYAILMGSVWQKYHAENTKFLVFTKICNEVYKNFGNDFFQYCGIGDLCLTATQEKSRNYRYGMSLVSKEQSNIKTIEGIESAKQILKSNIDILNEKNFPILFSISKIIVNTKNNNKINSLLSLLTQKQ